MGASDTLLKVEGTDSPPHSNLAQLSSLFFSHSNKVVQEPLLEMKQEPPSSSIHQGVQTITQPPPPQPTQQTPPTIPRLGPIGVQPALFKFIQARTTQQLPSSRKNRPIVPALSPGMTAGRTPSISAAAAAIQRIAAQAGALGASGSVPGQPQMPQLQVVHGQSGTVVLVSRAVGTPGQPATPGYVSVQVGKHWLCSSVCGPPFKAHS